ncbi:MAG: SDR family oxidoreductase [Candidatus Altiarchaeales archaeon]|nr:SDR family oxidoreductase [Candidatus Altiarchaeales archaeon]
MIKSVLVTGGGGYVGAVLVPHLLYNAYKVRVLDNFMFDDKVLDFIREHPNLEIVKGDIRDGKIVKESCRGMDAVIHLAAISNDPCCDLKPEITKEVNYDAVIQLVDIAKKSKIKRFINASSSSVYGIKEEENVTEDLPLEPITYYAKYKAETEKVIRDVASDDFVTVSVRPATVCGYSPSMRLDLSVNIMTNLAVNKGVMTVFGGEQRRPNIHIQDMVDLYAVLLNAPKRLINREIFNANCRNMKMIDIANTVKAIVGEHVKIEVTPTDDNRSYYTSSEKLIKTLNWQYRYTVEDAIRDMKRAFDNGLIPSPLDDLKYYHVKMMVKKGVK